MSVRFKREEKKPGLHFPLMVKDVQGQLLWETDTEMTLPDGTLCQASQCTTRPLCQAGVWLVPNLALRRGGLATSQVVTTTLGSLRCNTTQNGICER